MGRRRYFVMVLLIGCGDDGVHHLADAPPPPSRMVTCSPTLTTPACARLGPDFVSTGTNPIGPWSYGWSPTLAGEFSIYTLFFPGTDKSLEGLSIWSSPDLGTPGAVYLPVVGINPGTTPISPNGTYTVQPGQVIAHPGPAGQVSIARWTAPSAGDVTVQATFVGVSGTAGNPTTTTDVHVRGNGVDLYSGMLDPNGAGSTYCGASVVTVTAGDTIDFAVGYGNGSFLFDSTGVDAVVCPGG